VSLISHIVKVVHMLFGIRSNKTKDRLETSGKTEFWMLLLTFCDQARGRRQLHNTLTIRLFGGSAENSCNLTTCNKYKAHAKKITFGEQNSVCGLCTNLPIILPWSYVLLQTRKDLLVMVSSNSTIKICEQK
jgi:hypothetical protein